MCTVALVWVLHNVTYYDYVTLTDGVTLRAVDIRDDAITVVTKDGSQQIIACADGSCRRDDGLAIQYGLKTTWDGANKSLLLLCLTIFAPVTLVQSLRFQLLLRAQDIRLSYWESAKLCYAGNFLNFVTALGSTGGDAFKMYYVSLHTERKTEAVTTVVLDRIVGLSGLLLLVACVLLVRAGDSKLAMLGYGVGGLAAGGLLCGIVLFSQRVRRLILPKGALSKLPFADQLRRAESATRRLASHKVLLWSGLGCTLVLQVIAMTSFVFAALALGMRGDAAALWDYYAYLAGGMVVAAVPISFQGLGTMEAFYKHAFLDTHGTLSAILCLAMVVRAVGLFWALPGVIVTMTGTLETRE